MAFGLQFQLLFNPASIYSWVCSQSHHAETHWRRRSNSGLVSFQLRSDPKQKTMPTISLCSLQLSSKLFCPHSSGLSIFFQSALQFVFSLYCVWLSWEVFPLFSLFLLLRRAQHEIILFESMHWFWQQASDWHVQHQGRELEQGIWINR